MLSIISAPVFGERSSMTRIQVRSPRLLPPLKAKLNKADIVKPIFRDCSSFWTITRPRLSGTVLSRNSANNEARQHLFLSHRFPSKQQSSGLLAKLQSLLLRVCSHKPHRTESSQRIF